MSWVASSASRARHLYNPSDMGRAGLIALVVLAVIVIVGGVFIAWAVGVYNQLVALDQQVNAAWAQVQNQYQRRADLIPNLVETVKGFAAQERTVLEEVIKARASATQIKVTPELLNDPAALKKFQQAQGELSGALSRLLVTVERYPELKSNQNFLALQSQLEGTENRIAVERRRFNEAVREYNTRLRLFPGSLVASLRGFREKAYFEAAPGSEVAPKVRF
jgi:LemA protein